MSTIKDALQKRYRITLDQINFRCLKNLLPYGTKKGGSNAKQAVAKQN